MLERAAYEKELKSRAAEDDEEETLQVFEGGEGEDEDGTKMDVDTTANDLPSRSSKGKGKEVSANSTLNVSNKRRRPAIDPFAGEYKFHFSCILFPFLWCLSSSYRLWRRFKFVVQRYPIDDSR